MAISHDTASRLAQLEQILAATAARTASAGSDAAAVHMSSVPSERIRALTVALHDGKGREVDELDAVVMRLLLEEYVTAVSHLRAVARMAAAQIDAATAPVREARRAVHRYSKAVEGSQATTRDAAASAS